MGFNATFHSPLPNGKLTRSDDETRKTTRENTTTSYVPAFEFSTHELPVECQFDAWHKSFSSMLEFVEPDDRSAGFVGKQTTWDLHRLAFSRIKTAALGFTSVGSHARREPIDHWTMTLMLRGSLNTIAPTGTFKGGAGVVNIHALGRWFEGRVTRSEMLILFVPRDFCCDVAHSLNATEFSTINTGMGRLLSDYFIGLAKRLPTVDAANLPELVAATRAMILACVLPSSDHIEEAQEPIKRVLIERARNLVKEQLLDPSFNIEVLRRELGISRTGLYRLFEPFGGVMHYIQHRRLLDAHSALADPNDNRRIVEIAEQRCFSDGAEFSRAFKREFGYTPSEVRAGNRTVASRPTADLTDTAPEERLGLLLRRLHG